MPQRRQQDPRRIGQLAQYHPGGGDLRSRGRSQGPLTGDPSVTAPTERTAPAQQSPLFAGGPGEQPPQLERAAPVDTPLAGEGLMAPGFGGDTDMRTRPAPTEGGDPTSDRSAPGLQPPEHGQHRDRAPRTDNAVSQTPLSPDQTHCTPSPDQAVYRNVASASGV